MGLIISHRSALKYLPGGQFKTGQPCIGSNTREIVSKYTAVTHTVILTGSTSLLLNLKSGMGSPNWNGSLVDIHFRKLLWVYCPVHVGVKRNARADRLAGKAALKSGLFLGRSEMLRSLRHYLRAQSQGHHAIDRLEERGMERGSARRSSLKGRERAIVNQTNIGTVSKATLGKLLRGGVERVWAFPSA